MSENEVYNSFMYEGLSSLNRFYNFFALFSCFSSHHYHSVHVPTVGDLLNLLLQSLLILGLGDKGDHELSVHSVDKLRGYTADVPLTPRELSLGASFPLGRVEDLVDREDLGVGEGFEVDDLVLHIEC